MHKRYSGVAGLALVLVTAAGCTPSGKAGRSQRADSAKVDSARYVRGFDGLSSTTQLETLAEREALRPSAVDRELVDLLMGGTIQQLTPGSSGYSKAHRSLDEVLRRARSSGGVVERAEVPLVPQIGKGYVRARAAMMNGAYDEAAAMYEMLAESSPESVEIFVGLGDALMRAGDRGGALSAYERAVELGGDSTRVLVYAAMGATSRGAGVERVVELCSRVWDDELGTDRAGRVLGGVMLGRALLEDGSVAAGAEVLGEALGMLDAQTVRDPRYRRELVQLYTARGEQYVAIGDAWMMLGKPGRALGQYETAGTLVSQPANALVARKMAGHLMGGHSAMAAMTLLESIDANPGDESAGVHRLVELIGGHEIVGAMVAGSMMDRLREGSVARRRVVLGLVLSMIGDDRDTRDQAVDVMIGVDSEVLSPVSGARVLSLFEDWERVGLVVEMVERAPAVGTVMVPAMVRLDGRARALFDLVEGDSEGAGLVRCLIALDIGRVDWLGGFDDGNIGGLGERSTSWVIAHGRAAALGARWRLADRLFAECERRESGMDGGELFFYADSLVTANRNQAALELADRVADREGATAGDLLLRVRVRMMLSETEKVLSSLERAIELEPYDEAIYEQLITLRGSNGAFADIEALRAVTRMLGERLPGSALVGLIRAHEMAGAAAGRGEGDDRNAVMLGQVERMLVGLHERQAWREIGIDLLLSVWATQHSMGDERAIERGLVWVDGKLGEMPGSPDLVGAMARLLVLDGRVEEAEDFLRGVGERMEGRGFQRLEEGLIRADADRRDEGTELALDRLEGLVSVEDCLERIERAGAVGRLGEFDADLLVPVDSSWVYRDSQALRVVRVLGAIAQTSVDTDDAEILLELVERTRTQTGLERGLDGIDPLESLDLIELVVEPSGAGFSMDRYEALVRTKLDAEGGEELVTVAVQALMRSRSAGDALGLFTRLSVTNDGAFDPQRGGDLASLLGQIGSVEDVERSIERLDGAGVLVEARDAVVDSLGTLRDETLAEASDRDGVVADLVYSIAVVASFYNRDEAMGMYRLALSHDAGHAWANNDLGYKMVEDGGDLVEAERLLVLAHEAEPGAASITDSLAWAMYALGVMDDEVDGAGNVVRRGAVGLLREALLLEDGTDNATIYDHLGDALWMSGEFEGAVGAWLDAESRLRERLTELSNEENLNTTAMERIRAELSGIRFKIADGESGRVPSVAPTAVGLAVPMPATVPADIVEEIDPVK